MKLELRLDTDDKYFTHSFQQETECMRAHYDAVQPILHHVKQTLLLLLYYTTVLVYLFEY